MTTINERAPVKASSEIGIDADPDAVWDVLTAIPNWPSWNPDIKDAALEGPLASGSRFRCKAGPGTITSILRQVDPPRVLAWTGKTLGIDAIHVYRLDPRDGGTLLRTEESWEGLIVRLLRGSMQKQLEKALHDGPRYLKAEVERRVRAAGG